MEEGSLRCDANISLRLRGAKEFGEKVELKNINSFRFVEQALSYEIKRQTELLESGEKPVQETRLWDERKNESRPMRSKEYAEDYRYFPDPDLPRLIVDSQWIESVRDSLPELPAEVIKRFSSTYGLDDETCNILSQERLVALYFDSAVAAHYNPIAIANWISTELFGRLNKEGKSMSTCPISPENLASLVQLIDDEVISGRIAKKVFDKMFRAGTSPKAIVVQEDLEQISDESKIAVVIDEVLAEHESQVTEFREGKDSVFGFFVGQVMKKTSGKANPQLVNELLRSKLEVK